MLNLAVVVSGKRRWRDEVIRCHKVTPLTEIVLIALSKIATRTSNGVQRSRWDGDGDEFQSVKRL